MTKIAVTGATGQLGRHAVAALIERGIAPADIVAVVRDEAKAGDLGVSVRAADYTDEGALTAAFADVDRLLFISGSAVGQRIPQHTNVVRAAVAAGVGFVAYTSILHADTSQLQLAAEHKATERLLADSGVPHAFLRNSWYWENYVNAAKAAAEHGVLFGSAGEGRLAGAARADYAEAAAAVIIAGEQGSYELGGDAITYSQLAQVISDLSGKPVEYRNLPVAEYTTVLESNGLAAGYAAVLADGDAGIAAGALDTDSGDLQKLIGRPAATAADVLAVALDS